MEDHIKRIIQKIKNYLIDKYGSDIKKVIFYGSQVKGDSNKDSDIDIVVVVDEVINPVEVREDLSELILEILLNEKELVSVIVLPEEFFDNYNSPFILNVKEEGVVI